MKDHRPDNIFILAPNHRFPLDRISYPDWDAYASPLGSLFLDRTVCNELAACPAFRCEPMAHAMEHAVEIQLPFLQTVFESTPPIVPLLVPRLDTEQRQEAASALGKYTDGRTLFVISTDMTHYGADFGYVPFTDNIPEKLRLLDQGALDTILDWDAPRLLAYGRETGITMCGLEAAALVMSLPWPEPPRTSPVDYGRSGDREHDYRCSVSYASLIAYIDKTNGSDV